MVKTRFRLDPFQNALFLFCGLRNDWINGLYWEEEGFVLLYKRLESGNFQWPRNGDEAQQLTPQQYRWLEEQGSERNFAAGGNGIERTLRRRAELMPGGSSTRRSTPCRRISGRARRCLPGWNTAINCSPGRSGSKTSPPEERTKQRPKEEKPILDALLVWADSVSAAPKSALSFALPQGAMALSPAVSGGWTAGIEQQPGRAPHQVFCDRPQELSLCQHSAGRPGQYGDLQHD